MDTLSRYDDATQRLRANRDDRNALNDLIGLYEDAWRDYDHEIMDSVALYVTDLGRQDTVEVLEHAIDRTENPQIASEFRDWIAHLQKFRLTR